MNVRLTDETEVIGAVFWLLWARVRLMKGDGCSGSGFATRYSGSVGLQEPMNSDGNRSGVGGMIFMVGLQLGREEFR